MRRYITYLLAVIITLSVSSCFTNSRYSDGRMPPGKAKKVYGNKSAKKHAPGQKKKNSKKGKKSKHQHKHDVYYVPSYRY